MVEKLHNIKELVMGLRSTIVTLLFIFCVAAMATYTLIDAAAESYPELLESIGDMAQGFGFGVAATIAGRKLPEAFGNRKGDKV